LSAASAVITAPTSRSSIQSGENALVCGETSVDVENRLPSENLIVSLALSITRSSFVSSPLRRRSPAESSANDQRCSPR
jgi:hypothetical protein